MEKIDKQYEELEKEVEILFKEICEWTEDYRQQKVNKMTFPEYELKLNEYQLKKEILRNLGKTILYLNN